MFWLGAGTDPRSSSCGRPQHVLRQGRCPVGGQSQRPLRGPRWSRPPLVSVPGPRQHLRVLLQPAAPREHSGAPGSALTAPSPSSVLSQQYRDHCSSRVGARGGRRGRKAAIYRPVTRAELESRTDSHTHCGCGGNKELRFCHPDARREGMERGETHSGHAHRRTDTRTDVETDTHTH